LQAISIAIEQDTGNWRLPNNAAVKEIDEIMVVLPDEKCNSGSYKEIKGSQQSYEFILC